MAGLGGVLSGHREITGASYVCVVERDSARILDEVGGNDGETVDIVSIATLGRIVENMFGESGSDDVEDLMVSSRQSFHVLRQIAVPAGPVVLVYVRLPRGRANPAMARGELASVQFQRALIEALKAPEPVAPVVPLPRRYADPVESTPAGPSAPSARAALPAARSPLPAAAVGPQQPALATLSGMPALTPSRRDWAAAVIDQVRDLPTPAAMPVAASEVPAVHTPAASPATPAPEVGEDAVLLPLPRRSVGARLPPLSPPPLGSADHADQTDHTDRDGRMPSVLAQTWARDLSTMQRLVAGLRRLV